MRGVQGGEVTKPWAPALTRLVNEVDPLSPRRAQLHVELGALEAMAWAAKRWLAKRGEDGEESRVELMVRACKRLERARREV